MWAAAVLSKNDCELACDAATILRLGEEERADYGRTLIEMTRPGRNVLLINATTMTGSRHALKERIEMIAKKPKMAVYTLIAVILLAAAAVLVTFTGAKNDGFYQWLQNVELTDKTSVTVGQRSDDENIRLWVPLYEESDKEALMIIIRKISEDQIRKGTVTTEEQGCSLSMYDFDLSEENDSQFSVVRSADFYVLTSGDIYVVLDTETEKELKGGGKSWIIDNAALAAFITEKANAQKTEYQSSLRSIMADVKAEDFEDSSTLWNADREDTARILNQAANAASISESAEEMGRYWNLDIYLKEQSDDVAAGTIRRLELWCGLKENLVEITCYEGVSFEKMYLLDEALYHLVRHARDYEEIVDPEAYERFADVLVPQMEFHRKSMSEANGSFHDYELTRFCRIGAYEEEDGSRVELYDFDYALLPDDIESIVWAGGMYLDSQCRLQCFNGGGQFAVRYRDGKAAATAFMENDFCVSSADFENKEALEWIKERLKNALDQAE